MVRGFDSLFNTCKLKVHIINDNSNERLWIIYGHLLSLFDWFQKQFCNSNYMVNKQEASLKDI